VASAEELPFKDACLILPLPLCVYMDVPNPGKALQEAYRVLKPNGVFCNSLFSIHALILHTGKI
jgi:ubiquinone/menaquinone biosynthesis C-methylase UbiE